MSFVYSQVLIDGLEQNTAQAVTELSAEVNEKIDDVATDSIVADTGADGGEVATEEEVQNAIKYTEYDLLPYLDTDALTDNDLNISTAFFRVYGDNSARFYIVGTFAASPDTSADTFIILTSDYISASSNVSLKYIWQEEKNLIYIDSEGIKVDFSALNGVNYTTGAVLNFASFITSADFASVNIQDTLEGTEVVDAQTEPTQVNYYYDFTPESTNNISGSGILFTTLKLTCKNYDLNIFKLDWEGKIYIPTTKGGIYGPILSQSSIASNGLIEASYSGYINQSEEASILPILYTTRGLYYLSLTDSQGTGETVKGSAYYILPSSTTLTINATNTYESTNTASINNEKIKIEGNNYYKEIKNGTTKTAYYNLKNVYNGVSVDLMNISNVANIELPVICNVNDPGDLVGVSPLYVCNNNNLTAEINYSDGFKCIISIINNEHAFYESFIIPFVHIDPTVFNYTK